MIKAIIFDMDGVLVDSNMLHFLAYKKALEREGIEIAIDDYIKEGVGESDRHFFENMSEKHGKVMSFQKVEERKIKYYRELVEKKLQLREGISRLLQKLYGKYTLAVASSAEKELVEDVLKHFQLGTFFDFVIGGDEIPNKKPAPDIYLESARQLGLEPSQCVAIEDSAAGVISAKKAGLKCVAAPTKFSASHDFSKADSIIETLEELDVEKLENV